jgi:NAD(P)-dependent dehydrogenase (short-subunit alcohol dehydrogenase family)
MTRLQGRRALVTGASSGIGAVAARMLAAEGAEVALLARGDGVDAVAADISRECGRAIALRADVGDRADLQRAVASAVEQLGGLDVVLTAAAAGTFGRFDEVPAEDFDRCVAVTLGGTVDTIRAVLPELERSGGTLVVMGSAVDTISLTLMSAYVTAKGGLASFLETLRAELRARDSAVSLCEVRPGPVDTPFWRHLTHPEGLTPPPLPPLTSYSAETVARAAVACAIEPRDTVTVGGATLALAALDRVARPVLRQGLALVARVGRAAASSEGVPSALWSPSGDGTTGGGLGGRPSLWAALRLGRSRPKR